MNAATFVQTASLIHSVAGGTTKVEHHYKLVSFQKPTYYFPISYLHMFTNGI